jgi:hypothetical protein
MEKIILTFVFILSLTISTGCGKDAVTPDRCNATLFNEEVNPKLVAWQEAATAYANDQSVANCNDYKTTGQDWLESIRRYQDCGAIYTQDWQDAVSDAQAELAAIPCN